MDSLMHFLSMFYAGAVADAIGGSIISFSSKNISIHHPLKNKDKVGVLGQTTSNTESLVLLLQYFYDRRNQYLIDDVIPLYGKWLLTQPPYINPIFDKLLYSVFDREQFVERQKEFYEEHAILDDPIFKEINSSFVHVPVFLLQVLHDKDINAIVSSHRDAYLISNTSFSKKANAIYVKLLYSHLTKQKFHITINFKDSQLKQILKDAKKGIRRNVTLKGQHWVGHTLYCALYTHYHLNDFRKGMEWVVDLGGDILSNSFVVGCVLGAKLGYSLLTNLFFESQLDVVLKADPQQGSIKRPSSLQPTNISRLLEKMLSSPTLYPILQSIPNRNYLLTYLQEGYVPVSYRSTSKKSSSSSVNNAYFIFDRKTLGVVKVIEDKEKYYPQYWVQSIDIKKNVDELSEIVDSLPSNPNKANLLFRGKPTSADRAYIFVHHFARALVYRVLEKSSSPPTRREFNSFDLSTITDESLLSLFYDKKYFIIEG